MSRFLTDMVNVVYTSVNYKTPWDGSRKGVALPVGTYYYIIRDPYDSLKTITGPLTIFR